MVLGERPDDQNIVNMTEWRSNASSEPTGGGGLLDILDTMYSEAEQTEGPSELDAEVAQVLHLIMSGPSLSATEKAHLAYVRANIDDLKKSAWTDNAWNYFRESRTKRMEEFDG